MNKKVELVLTELLSSGRLEIEQDFLQHGDISVLEHSIHVAEISLLIVGFLHIKYHEKALIRGSLLHDYFLYDWHDKETSPSLHGFKHPKIALENAKKDYDIDAIEENIIKRHMFPLTIVPPTCRESWIVCLADKYCATQETIAPRISHCWQKIKSSIS